MRPVRFESFARLAVVTAAVALASGAAPGGQAPGVAPPAARPAPPAAAPDTYRIGPEDLLDIVMWKNADVTRTVPVRPDGRISLPLLNDVQAAALTPMELREYLTKRYAEFFDDPEVSVLVREVHSLKVSVVGQVKTPGRYEVKSQVTVLEALALAGGLTEYAKRDRIIVLRRDGEGWRRIPFNYNKVLTDWDERDNFALEPGDIIVVP